MRTLDWDGSCDVRDLGGLPTPLSSTGATIRGRVARGPRRELLTAAGWIAATRWGLLSVVDLRSRDEVGPRGADPNAEPPEGVAISCAPTEDQAHPEFRVVCLPILDSPEYWRHNVRILPGLVRCALEAIAASDPGVLVQCAGGRDRTGMVSALLLAHAGVSADDIVADYSESVRAMAGTAAHGGPTHDRQASWSPEQVDAWLVDVEPFVRDFVAAPCSILDELELGNDTRWVLLWLLTER